MIPLGQKAHSLWLLFLFAVIGFLTGIYVGAGVNARNYELVATLLLVYGTLWWLGSDLYKRNYPSEMAGLFDQGWFLMWGLLFVVPYHLISTRKWRGAVFVIIAFLLVIIAAALGTSAGHMIRGSSD